MANFHIRTALAACTISLLALSAGGCSTSSDADAQQAAVEYLSAADAGNHERYCDLSVDGNENREKCLEYSRIANDIPGFESQPKAVAVQNWGDHGKAVVVEVGLQAGQGASRYMVLGLVELDDRWLVKDTSGYLSSLPDAAAVDQELA